MESDRRCYSYGARRPRTRPRAARSPPSLAKGVAVTSVVKKPASGWKVLFQVLFWFVLLPVALFEVVKLLTGV